MNRYRATVVVKKNYIAEQEVTFEVSAANRETAALDACALADRHVLIGNYDADHDCTDVDIMSIELIEGEPTENDQTPRCDKTIDMFGHSLA